MEYCCLCGLDYLCVHSVACPAAASHLYESSPEHIAIPPKITHQKQDVGSMLGKR